jgi:hypothetical protein
LTKGVGDLRLFIDNFLELPLGQERKYVFQIKEEHEITLLRDLVIIFMAFDSTNFIRTAEAMVHYCKQILATYLSVPIRPGSSTSSKDRPV